jgi:poly(beta-D-mannuronate) lyase
MRVKNVGLALAALSFSQAYSASVYIENPGFEDGFNGWEEANPDGSEESGESYTGFTAAKIATSGGLVTQTVLFVANTNYVLTAYVKGTGKIGVNLGSSTESAALVSDDYKEVTVPFNSGSATSGVIFAAYNDGEGYFDDFSLKGDSFVADSDGGCSSIDFRYWGVTFPDGESLNDPSDIHQYLISKEPRVINGVTKDWITWSVDGCPTFVAPPNDSVDPQVDSTKSSSFVRSELRELLTIYFNHSYDPTDIKNQWVTSKASSSNQNSAGGVNGNLKATLIVNSVTESGSIAEQEGRIVVGQIHGIESEPVKIYYQKIAGQDKGSVFMRVDGEGGNPSDLITFFGYNDKVTSISRREQFEPTVDGIALGDEWGYEIDLRGDQLQVTITHDGKTYTTADAIAYSKEYMSESSSGTSDAYVQRVSSDTNAITIGSWYDNDWMYFKAGVYNQNNWGDGDDVASVTFTSLVQCHDIDGNEKCKNTQKTDGNENGQDKTSRAGAARYEVMSRKMYLAVFWVFLIDAHLLWDSFWAF